MIIDNAGTYTLRYTATDDCGKTTTVDRELVVAEPVRRTVLYNDGTLIINEHPKDIAINIATHGDVYKTYIPFNPNGETDVEKYVFNTVSDTPWYSEIGRIVTIIIAQEIMPTSIKCWFNGYQNLTTIDFGDLDTSLITDMSYVFGGKYALDLSSLNTSNVTSMYHMFTGQIPSIEFGENFDTSKVTNMSYMFQQCTKVASLDLSMFDTRSVTEMQYMFDHCEALTNLDLTSFDTSNVTNMLQMFSNCKLLEVLDLSSFNTSNVTNTNQMFYASRALRTVYASNLFNTNNVTNSTGMFSYTNAIVGGAGTAWTSSNPTNKTYARIDGGTSNPGYFTANA